MDTREIFPQRILNLRYEHNLTQQQVADDLDISRVTLGFYETGKRLPDAEMLGKIAKYYNVSSDFLIGLCNDKTVDVNLKAASNYTGLSVDAIKLISDSFSPEIRLKAFDVMLEEAEFKTSHREDYREAYREEIEEKSEVVNYIIELNMLEKFASSMRLLNKLSTRHLNAYYGILTSGYDIATIAQKLNVDFEVIFEHLESLPRPDGTGFLKFGRSDPQLSELNSKCDLQRYELIKLCEQISNMFDHRKEYLEYNRESLLMYLKLTEEDLKELQAKVKQEEKSGKHNEKAE